MQLAHLGLIICLAAHSTCASSAQGRGAPQRQGGEDPGATSTQSLEQNIEDYYNSVDIEFENLNESDKSFNIDDLNTILGERGNTSGPFATTLDSPLGQGEGGGRSRRSDADQAPLGDDVEQEIYEELVEAYDDEEEESTQDASAWSHPSVDVVSRQGDGEKFYRDTFMDRIIEDMKASRGKEPARRHKREGSPPGRQDREHTGDTVLHLQSEISDVIKSETDLKSSALPQNKPPHNKESTKSDSYVDNFMIHPSQFIQDTTPFSSGGEAAPLGDRQQHPEEEGGARNKKNAAGRASFEDNTTAHSNSSDLILAMLDSRKQLECRLPTQQGRAIVWIKDGEKIPLSGVAALGYEMTPKGDLIIRRIGREHQGKWRCEEEKSDANTLHSADKDRDLIVMESPSAPYLEVFGRRLDPGNLFLPAREGTELVMACHVERGSPPPTLYWETSKPMHMSHQHKQGAQFMSAVAAVVVRRSHHNTTITCVCKHPSLQGALVASTLLHVQYAPRFGISRTPGFGFPLEEGSAVSLKCDVDSNPPAAPTWRKDEKEPPVEQSDDGYLNFTSVRRDHSGWYKCSATHPLGNFSSIGYFLNVRYEVESATEQQVYHQTVSRTEEQLAGGVVQLQCPPGSVGCWSRNTPPPPPSSPVGLIKPDKQGSSYVCSGLSPSEASRLHAMLGEHRAFNGGTPVVYPSNASLSVREGSSVVLEGEFCLESGEPPVRVLWLAQGRALKLPDNYNRIVTHQSRPSNSTASVQCNVAQLSINKSTAADSGEYSLVVRGKRGVGEAIFHVHVLQRAEGEPLLEPVYGAGAGAGGHHPLCVLGALTTAITLLYC